MSSGILRPGPKLLRTMRPAPVDPHQSFPDLEQQVLERWRERDVFHESCAAARAREPWVFWEGPPTANGPPGRPPRARARLQGHLPALPDDARATTSSARAAGTPTACRSRSPSRSSSASPPRTRSRSYGIAEFNQKCRESVFAFLEDWNALTERIGFWVDLDHAYRTLDATYVESVWWALQADRRQGPALRGPQGRALLPALRHRAVQPRGRARATRTSRTRRSTCASRSRATAARCRPATSCWCGRRRRGRSSPTPRSPSTPSSSTCARRPAGWTRRSCSPRRSSRRVLGEPTASSPRALPGRRARRRRATSRRSTTSPAASTASAATRVLLGDFVTADDGTGLVHTAIAFGEDDFRLGAQYGLTVVNPVRLDGTYDERIGRYAGRFVKDADADLIEDLRARGRLLRAERLRALLPALLALRHAAALLRQAVVVHRARRSSATDCWPPTSRSTGTPSTSSTGASATGWRTTSTGRCRASATGARRCRSGAASNGHVHVHRLASTSSRSARACGSRTRTAPTSTTVDVPLRRSAASAMTRVPEVIDVWFDSGAMPFAQRHAPFENQERFDEPLPRRLHLRGARPDARLVLLAARRLDAAVRPRRPTATSSASA